MIARRHCGGYSLIEVLVAMMILVLSLTVIFRIFSGGLNKISITSDYARAVIIAESMIAATGKTEMLRVGESSGDVLDDYHWARTISVYQPDGEASWDELPVFAYDVSVVVEWPGNRDSGNRRLELHSLKLEPKR